ncbi:UbiA family prenyltransferase, partial [Halosolutus amylolyticus]
SISAASVVVTTIGLADLPFDPRPFFIVVAVTMFVYTVNRFTDLEEDEANVPQRAAFIKRYGRLWLAVGTVLYLAAIGFAIALDVPGVGFMIVPLLAAILYSTVGVKRLFLVKNLFVGAAWALIPLGVGYYFGRPWQFEILFLTAYVGAMITIAAVIFDVKDIEGDRAEGIRTVPNTFGPGWTRIVSQVANVLVAALVPVVVAAGVLSPEFLVLLAFNGYVGAYIPFATPDRGPLFYGFVVDGEHLFLAVLVVVLEWAVW